MARRAMELTQPWFDEDEGEDDTDDADANTRPSRTTTSLLRRVDLVSRMTTFRHYCRTQFPPGQSASYKVKLAVMYGPTATRCPVWPADHVPLRWIQTFCGPGCHHLVEHPSTTDDPVEDEAPHPFFDRSLARI